MNDPQAPKSCSQISGFSSGRLIYGIIKIQGFHRLGQWATAGRSKASGSRPLCSSRRTSRKKQTKKKKISDPLGNGELKIYALIKHHLQTSAVMLGVSWRGQGDKLQATNPITSGEKTCPGITPQHLSKEGAPWRPGANTLHPHPIPSPVLTGARATAAELDAIKHSILCKWRRADRVFPGFRGTRTESWIPPRSCRN